MGLLFAGPAVRVLVIGLAVVLMIGLIVLRKVDPEGFEALRAARRRRSNGPIAVVLAVIGMVAIAVVAWMVIALVSSLPGWR